MPVFQQNFITVSCDAEGCDKTATFELRQGPTGLVVEDKVIEENPWLKTRRLAQTVDGRNFAYCSDLCEVRGIESGKHNPPEQKQIVEANGGAAAIAMAAAEARKKELADKAIREGKPASVKITG